MSDVHTATISTYDIYRDLKTGIPPGYKKTGDFRIPRINDTFLQPDGQVSTLNKGDKAVRGPRLILEKVKPRPEDIYIKGIVPPKGYKLGEFKSVQDCMFVLGVNGQLYDGGITFCNTNFERYRYELLPVPKRWLIEVESEEKPVSGLDNDRGSIYDRKLYDYSSGEELNVISVKPA